MIDFERLLKEEKEGTHFKVVFKFGKDEREAHIFQAEQAKHGLISEIREVAN